MPNEHNEWESIILYDTEHKEIKYEKVKRSHWRLETDEEEPNPLFKSIVCCNCNRCVGAVNLETDYIYCPYCGSKNI